MRHIFKCPSCGKYTLNDICICGTPTVNPAPAKFSPEDNYASYRRRAKMAQWKEKGLV